MITLARLLKIMFLNELDCFESNGWEEYDVVCHSGHEAGKTRNHCSFDRNVVGQRDPGILQELTQQRQCYG